MTPGHDSSVAWLRLVWRVLVSKDTSSLAGTPLYMVYDSSDATTYGSFGLLLSFLLLLYQFPKPFFLYKTRYVAFSLEVVTPLPHQKA